jgi:hypothetical protein
MQGNAMTDPAIDAKAAQAAKHLSNTELAQRLRKAI